MFTIYIIFIVMPSFTIGSKYLILSIINKILSCKSISA